MKNYPVRQGSGWRTGSGRALRIVPLGDRTTFVYDAGSYLIEKKDRNDRLCTYAYDALGRLASETWKDAGGTIVNALTYTYDVNSNLLTAADDNGTYTFTYDALDRVATQQDIWAKTLTFTYDNADNRTQVEDSEGGVTTSVYDADNRLTSRRFDDGTAELRIDFTYTSRDQVATATRYSDVAGLTQVGSSAYAYDDSLRLTNLQHKSAAATTLANYTYTYDVADRLTSETRNGTAVTYTYDATNQLLTDGSGGGGPYDYDLNGNRTAYTTGADNRLLSDGVYTYTYDDEGNRTRRESLGGGDIWVYAYDNANRLVLAQHKDTDEDPVDAEYTFQYDVFGNRIEVSQDDDGEGEGSAVVTRFAYDGFHIWADLDSGSSLTMRRVFGDQIDQLVARIDGSMIAWPLQDRLGSVREIANNSDGSFIYEVTYDGFGNILSESGAGGDRYGFTGREWFAGVGVADYRNRSYDPLIGRFLQKDPSFIEGGDANFFRYVFNSPTNFTDPLGLEIFFDDFDGQTSAAAQQFMQETARELGNAAPPGTRIGGVTRGNGRNGVIAFDDNTLGLFRAGAPRGERGAGPPRPNGNNIPVRDAYTHYAGSATNHAIVRRNPDGTLRIEPYRPTPEQERALDDLAAEYGRSESYEMQREIERLARGPLANQPREGPVVNQPRPVETLTGDENRTNEPDLLESLWDTVRPRPVDDTVQAIDAATAAIADSNLTPRDRAMLGLAAVAGVIFGLTDIIDVIPDPSDWLQRANRNTIRNILEEAGERARRAADDVQHAGGNADDVLQNVIDPPAGGRAGNNVPSPGAEPDVLHHGSPVPPEIIFEEGLIPPGLNMDLDAHIADIGDSGYVSGTRRIEDAAPFAQEGGWVYRYDRPTDAIDIEQYIGGYGPYGNEGEFATPHAIDPSLIIGAFEFGRNEIPTGRFLPNPGFIGPRH